MTKLKGKEIQGRRIGLKINMHVEGNQLTFIYLFWRMTSEEEGGREEDEGRREGERERERERERSRCTLPYSFSPFLPLSVIAGLVYIQFIANSDYIRPLELNLLFIPRCNKEKI